MCHHSDSDESRIPSPYPTESRLQNNDDTQHESTESHIPRPHPSSCAAESPMMEENATQNAPTEPPAADKETVAIHDESGNDKEEVTVEVIVDDDVISAAGQV